MRFRTGEHELPTAQEPRVLNAVIDPNDAATYAAFAKGRSLDEIYSFWKDPEVTSPTVRQRAVAALTAPHGAILPFPHSEQSIGRLLHMEEEINGEQIHSLRERLEGRSELSAELARGILYWLEKTDDRTKGDGFDSSHYYQYAIQQLLPLVDEETGDKLFAHYSINDIDPFWNLDSCSGYRPLMNLLSDSGTPRKYTDMGLAEWLDIADKEERGAAKPRVEHERATEIMAQFIQTMTFGENVDDYIHTVIATFLEDHTPANKTYIEGFAVLRVGEHIADEQVRFSYACRHIFGSTLDHWGHFTIQDEQDLAFVEWVGTEALARGLPRVAAMAQDLARAYKPEL